MTANLIKSMVPDANCLTMGTHIFFRRARIQSVMRRSCPALILLCSLSVLTFAEAADPVLAAGLQLLDEGRTTLQEDALNRARDYFLRLTRENSSNALYCYELARVDYYRSSSVRGSKGNKAAAAILDQAIADAQEALKLDEHSAVAHSLLADLYGNKIGLGVGFMLGARLGPKVDAENKRALELDSNNPQVLASLGRQYLHAPKMFGGDLDKAIANLQSRSTVLLQRTKPTCGWLLPIERKVIPLLRTRLWTRLCGETHATCLP